jgi:hypothetical protein
MQSSGTVMLILQNYRKKTKGYPTERPLILLGYKVEAKTVIQ